MVLRGQDAWRRHPIFKWGITDAIPGLREGAAAFGVFLAADYLYSRFGPAPEHHGHGHGNGHGAAAAVHGDAAPPAAGAGSSHAGH